MPGSETGGLLESRLDQPGFFGGGALPSDDHVGVCVDDEGCVGEPAGGHPHVGEVGYHQLAWSRRTEVTVDEVRSPLVGRIRNRGPDLLFPGHTFPAVGCHEPFHRAAGHLDALPVEMSPHLE